ncbi:MAG: coproporphyrinogen dehydrogenase HemZ [Flavonifractor plautii]
MPDGGADRPAVHRPGAPADFEAGLLRRGHRRPGRRAPLGGADRGAAGEDPHQGHAGRGRPGPGGAAAAGHLSGDGGTAAAGHGLRRGQPGGPARLAPGEVSLYVGIPFCPTRCAYCSFVSADVGRALKLIDPFLDALCRELAATGAMLADAGLRVRTVYFGGGTPTTLSAPQLDRLMGELADHIDLSGCTEYTVEAGRPDTITAEKLAVLARRGCSRVSVNPQTMQDAVLERMGRAHRADDILRAYALARESGIGCINMDLIAGLPGDSAAGFRASLEQVLALGPENVTVHTLALKKGSRLMEEGGGLPSGAAVADMLDFAWAALRAAGQRPYYLYRQKYMSGSFENVGWCRPGAESLYNICMMEELHTIVSLGGGGVTKLVDRATGYIERLANAKYPQEYIQKIDAICADKARVAQFYAAHGR